MIASDRSVVAVLVNFRAPELVSDTAVALTAGGIPTIVADNSGELRGAPFPVIDCGTNVGFGAACNRAVAALDDAFGVAFDAVCLHNPDLVPAPASLARLATRLEPGDGAIAPAIRVDHVVRTRGFHAPSVAREAYLAGRARRHRDAGPAERTGGERPVRVVGGRRRRFGSGALLVVDRRAYAAVRGFDERYFLYGEDLDLWHRLNRAGFRNRFAADVVFEHHAKQGSEMGRATRELLRWLGVEQFAELHARGRWRAYRAIHRTALAGLGADAALTTLVEDAWRAGARPSDVSAIVRRDLEHRDRRAAVTPGAR